MITPADKLRCAEREIAQRRRVYANLVAKGSKTQAWADREIAIMRAIAADYRAQVEAERKDLFGGPDA